MKIVEKDSLLADSFRKFEQNIKPEIPAGYIEMRLSTKGRVGAPEVFHIRNFKVGELLNLAISTDAELPKRLISTLNEMIYEDVDVAQFHEKEVEELMVYLFVNFYQNKLEDVIFPLEESDFEYIRQTKPDMLDDLATGKWMPRTTIHIENDADVYDVSDSFNPNITITNKKTGFYVTFGFIKYGDRLVVKDFLDNYYKDEEAKFVKVKNQISRNNNTPLDPELEREYMEYLNKRFETLSNISRLISVSDYNGMDVSNMNIFDKFEVLSNDARIDFGMIAKLTQKQNKEPFGIKPEVRMKNPLTGEMVTRRFSFRISTILQAIQVSGSDQYDDGSDSEDEHNLG